MSSSTSPSAPFGSPSGVFVGAVDADRGHRGLGHARAREVRVEVGLDVAAAELDDRQRLAGAVGAGRESVDLGPAPAGCSCAAHGRRGPEPGAAPAAGRRARARRRRASAELGRDGQRAGALADRLPGVGRRDQLQLGAEQPGAACRPCRRTDPAGRQVDRRPRAPAASTADRTARRRPGRRRTAAANSAGSARGRRVGNGARRRSTTVTSTHSPGSTGPTTSAPRDRRPRAARDPYARLALHPLILPQRQGPRPSAGQPADGGAGEQIPATAAAASTPKSSQKFAGMPMSRPRSASPRSSAG